MKIRSMVPSGRFGANAWFVTGEAGTLLIDPSVTPYEAERAPGINPGKVAAILLTHGHFDHIFALDDWARLGVPVFVGEGDKDMLSDTCKNAYSLFYSGRFSFSGNVIPVLPGARLSLAGFEISVLGLPGHTPGGVGYLIGDALFSGDTVFAGGGRGRTDLPGGSEKDLLASIRSLRTLPGKTVIYPGHGEPFSVCDLSFC